MTLHHSKIQNAEQQKEKWKAKPIHGKYLTAAEKQYINTMGLQAWLGTGNLFVETEGFVAAII